MGALVSLGSAAVLAVAPWLRDRHATGRPAGPRISLSPRFMIIILGYHRLSRVPAIRASRVTRGDEEGV